MYYDLLSAALHACPGVFCRQGDMVELLGEVQSVYGIFPEKDPEQLEHVLNTSADMLRT